MDAFTASFFNLSNDFKRTLIPGGQTQGSVIVPEDKTFTTPEEMLRKPKGTNYALDYKKQDEIKMCQQVKASLVSGSLHQSYVADRDRMSGVDDLTSVAASLSVVDDGESLLSVFDGRYNMTSRREIIDLPITAQKVNIVSMINANPTVVITGVTGCGKSTQVPQYVFDYCYDHKIPCNIVVTQPRRIAAITVAKRVCAERNWEIGELVGYQVGLDKTHISEDTRLTFCTTGVLLQMLIGQKSLNRYTHIIIDEVHERNQDLDFILIILRMLLQTASPSVKVVLMSATINAAMFSNYFVTYTLQPNRMRKITAPVIDLNKEFKPPHPIYISYLCQLNPLLCPLPEIIEDEPGISQAGFALAVTLIRELDRLDTSMNLDHKPHRGAVLVFLPGINEIEELYNLLAAEDSANNRNWWLLPLHSMITTEEQSKVFQRPADKTRKIILSTNIAESSITVPDIVYVLDFCLTKHLYCDPNTNFSSLQLAWASKSSCTQRAGRSGRVCPGRVYRLVPQRFYEMLNDEDRPEILRGPLERVILLAKMLDMGEPKAILGLAIDPPDLGAIETSILSLKEKGALLPTLSTQFTVTDGDITFLGRVMARLPVDPSIAKMILLGHVFSMLKETIVMGAAMSLKSVFSTPFDKKLEAYNGRLAWADSSCSDCISFLNAYNVWLFNKNNGYFERCVPGSSEKDWSKRYYIQMRAMNEVHLLVSDLTKRLRSLGVEEARGAGRLEWTATERPLILKIILAGAFYPNYFARGEQGGQVNEKDAVKLLNGHDPYSTVYMQGFPMDQPKELYKECIKKKLKNCCPEMMVTFDSSSKVYVEFGTSRSNVVHHGSNHALRAFMPGKIKMGVYRAIKMRQINQLVKINMLPPKVAKDLAIQYGIPTENTTTWAYENRVVDEDNVKKQLPSMDTTVMPLLITFHINAGHFWAQNMDRTSFDGQTWFFEMLKDTKHLVEIAGYPREGRVYAAPFTDESGKNYFRARVLSKLSIAVDQQAKRQVEVHFIDFGNREYVSVSEMRAFGPELIEKGIMRVPELAFECVLANVQPSIVANQNGFWTEQANNALKHKLSNGPLFGRIYSVVSGVVSIELFVKELNRASKQYVEVNVNDWLIEKGYGQQAEESVFSKENHEIRMMRDLEADQQAHYEKLQESKFALQSNFVQLPDRLDRPILTTLKGPSSPLEMKVYAQTRVGGHRTVSIEPMSVNAVLLDTDAQDPHERLLVAACVGESGDRTRITLRHTTMMPNIHGLPALMCLIFSPTVEFRTNAKRNRLTGAVCGLGLNPDTGRAVFPDHDIEVAFDTEISTEDIQDVNRLRFWMNQCFVVDDGMDRLSEDCTDVLKAQQKIRSSIYGLLKKPRKSVPLEMARTPFKWFGKDLRHAITPTREVSVLEKNRARGVFQFHWAVRLRLADEKKDEMILKLSTVSQLHERVDAYIRKSRISRSSLEPDRSEKCLLCDFQCYGLLNMAEHINSPEHEEVAVNVTKELQEDSEGWDEC